MGVPGTSRTRQRVFRSGNAFMPWLLPAVLLAAVVSLGLAVLLGELGKPRWESWFLPPALLALAAMLAVQNRRTLTSDATGLRFRGNLPSLVAGWAPDWSLAWRDIQAVHWAWGPQPTLRIEARGGSHKLNAFEWQLDAAEWKRCQRAMRALRGPSRAALDPSILPLVRELREHGVIVPDSIAPDRGPAGFDLAKNPATRIAMAVMGVAGAFWFADAMVSDQMYVHEPWLAIAGVSLAAMALMALAQARAQVPGGVNAALTLIGGVVIALAAYGALQRLNQLADRGAARVVEYTLQPDGSLRPDEPGASTLRPGFFGDAAFWRAQRPGSRHRFIRHDALGFETLDIREYRERLGAFYGRDPGRDTRRI